jgi:hypothetical protein
MKSKNIIFLSVLFLIFSILSVSHSATFGALTNFHPSSLGGYYVLQEGTNCDQVSVSPTTISFWNCSYACIYSDALAHDVLAQNCDSFCSLSAINGIQPIRFNPCPIVNPPPSGGGGGTHTLCQNNIKEGREDCDITDLGGQSCVGLGWKKGSLGCTKDCIYNTTDCSIICGNGIREDTESCDTYDSGGQTCQSLGFASGDLFCNRQCQFYTAFCKVKPVTQPVCSNRHCEEGETYDTCPIDCPNPQTISDLNFTKLNMPPQAINQTNNQTTGTGTKSNYDFFWIVVILVVIVLVLVLLFKRARR